MHRLSLICTATLLSACAGLPAPVEPAHDPNHKQFMTGSRIAFKGRGGPDAVKTVSAQDARDQMRTVIESKPQSE